MITLTINSATLTSKEAGAAASMLLALHPDCLADAIGTLTEGGDPNQLRLDLEALERGTPEQTPTRTAAEAFGAAGAVAPEAGVPFANPGHAVAPPASPVPVAPVAAAPANSGGASTGPAAGATAPVAGVELDSTGLPWDARIHSTPPSLTKKGPWRAKKNLNQLTAHAVEAELRAALAAPAAGTAAPAPAPASVETPAERTAREAVEQGLIAAPLPVAAAIPAPPVASAPVAAPPPPPASVASVPPVSPPLPAPAAGSPAPSPAADDATPPATLFANAMRKVTKAQLDGHITVPETDAILTHLGLAQMRDLIARPDLIPVFDESVDNHVARYATAS